MQDSFVDLIKVLLPEIIVDYFELTSYKKEEEILHLYLKETNSVAKDYRQSNLGLKGFFDEITVQDFQIRGHQLYLHVSLRRWLHENTGQVLFGPASYLEEYSSRPKSGNTGVCVFFKRDQ
jgi:hypothetical protein